jgi:transposase
VGAPTKQWQALAQRSRIVLLAAEGLKNTDVAQRLGISQKMATKWRERCATDRLNGLLDEPRPGQPRTVSDEHVEDVITKTLQTTPKHATHSSTGLASSGADLRPFGYWKFGRIPSRAGAPGATRCRAQVVWQWSRRPGGTGSVTGASAR